MPRASEEREFSFEKKMNDFICFFISSRMFISSFIEQLVNVTSPVGDFLIRYNFLAILLGILKLNFLIIYSVNCMSNYVFRLRYQKKIVIFLISLPFSFLIHPFSKTDVSVWVWKITNVPCIT
jgi:hypothetical protein